jgi:hypothetical protein
MLSTSMILISNIQHDEMYILLLIKTTNLLQLDFDKT